LLHATVNIARFVRIACNNTRVRTYTYVSMMTRAFKSSSLLCPLYWG